MPANIGTKWVSGNLVVFDKVSGTDLFKFDSANQAIDILAPLKINGVTQKQAAIADIEAVDAATTKINEILAALRSANIISNA